jgi:hypothetical protein
MVVDSHDATLFAQLVEGSGVVFLVVSFDPHGGVIPTEAKRSGGI